MIFRHIRFTLTLWYIVILGIILTSFSTFLYFTLSRSLYKGIDVKIKSIAPGSDYDISLHYYYAECAYKLRDYKTAFEQYTTLLKFRTDKFFLTNSVELIKHKLRLCKRFIERQYLSHRVLVSPMGSRPPSWNLFPRFRSRLLFVGKLIFHYFSTYFSILAVRLIK